MIVMVEAKLIFGDCLEKIKEIPDNSIDAVITDPPYGINYLSGWYKNGNPHGEIIGDDKLLLPIDLLLSKVKEGGAVFSFYSQKKPIIYDGIKNVLIWVKNNWSAGDLEGDFGNQYEPIAFIPKGDFKLRSYRLSNVIHAARQPSELHPTQKPVEVMEYLIEASTRQGDTVLDPFMGSGTTGVAALRMNRNFIGIEIDETYFKIAKKRIGETKEQTRLTDNPIPPAPKGAGILGD